MLIGTCPNCDKEEVEIVSGVCRRCYKFHLRTGKTRPKIVVKTHVTTEGRICPECKELRKGYFVHGVCKRCNARKLGEDYSKPVNQRCTECGAVVVNYRWRGLCHKHYMMHYHAGTLPETDNKKAKVRRCLRCNRNFFTDRFYLCAHCRKVNESCGSVRRMVMDY